MKITKLGLIIGGLGLICNSAYAWHNEFPPEGFKICNKTGNSVSINLSHFQNILWHVPGDSGEATKSNFDLANNSCGVLKVWPHYDQNGLSKLFLEAKGARGSVGFDIRSYTKDEHERRGASSNQMNAWNAMSYSSTGKWTAEALVDKSVVYERKSECSHYDHMDRVCYSWKETFPSWQNGSGLIDLASYGNGYGLSLLTAPSKQQEIDLIDTSVSGNIPEQQFISVSYNTFNDSLPSGDKYKAISNLKGSSINWKQYPNVKMCRAYGFVLDLSNVKPVSQTIIDYKLSPVKKVIAASSIHPNPGNTTMTVNTALFSDSIAETRLFTFTSGWKYGVGLKFSTKFSVMLKEIGAEFSANYEYNEAQSTTTSTTQTRTYTYSPQNIPVPPMTTLTYVIESEVQEVTADYSYDYAVTNPSFRADVALDGNCRNSSEGNRKQVEINAYNIFKYTPKSKLINGFSSDDKKEGLVYMNVKGTIKGETGGVSMRGTPYFKPYKSGDLTKGNILLKKTKNNSNVMNVNYGVAIPFQSK